VRGILRNEAGLAVKEEKKKMKVSDIGEFGLIERIRKSTRARDKNIIIGIGDDAAAIKAPGHKYILLTTDTLVEGVHFDLKYFNFFELGWKLMAVNLSDIAAMGGKPEYALVTLGLPKNTKVSDIDSFYSGIKALGKKHDVKVIGGDIVNSPKSLFFTMDVFGTAGKVIRRSGAGIGDVIAAIENFGSSSAGLTALKRYGRKALSLKPCAFNSRSHLMPLPMVDEGRRIAKYATSMMDNSDGLARCLIEICKESKVGAKVYLGKIPLAKGANLKDALDGGEDYNLVFTLSRNKIRSIKNCRIIGEITSGKRIYLIGSNGRKSTLKDKGYEQI